MQRLIKEIKDVFQIEIKQTPLWIRLRVHVPQGFKNFYGYTAVCLFD